MNVNSTPAHHSQDKTNFAGSVLRPSGQHRCCKRQNEIKLFNKGFLFLKTIIENVLLVVDVILNRLPVFKKLVNWIKYIYSSPMKSVIFNNFFPTIFRLDKPAFRRVKEEGRCILFKYSRKELWNHTLHLCWICLYHEKFFFMMNACDWLYNYIYKGRWCSLLKQE